MMSSITTAPVRPLRPSFRDYPMKEIKRLSPRYARRVAKPMVRRSIRRTAMATIREALWA